MAALRSQQATEDISVDDILRLEPEPETISLADVARIEMPAPTAPPRPPAPTVMARSRTGALYPQPAAPGRVPQDIGISALKGTIAVPEFVVGLADIVSGGRAGRVLESTVGFRPGEAKAALERGYSPAQQAANRAVGAADGVVGTAKAALTHPSTIAHAVVESAPSMIGGAGVGRSLVRAGLKALPAAAAGEAAVSAGLAAEQTRQASPEGTLTPKQAALSAASGVATGGLSLLGGRIAKSLGVADVDTLLVQARQNPAAQASLVKAVLAGAAQEGLLEELPQSVQEQILQNVSQGKPWEADVDQTAVLGALAGATMGGGVQAVHGALPPAPAPPAPAPATPPPLQAVTLPAEAPVAAPAGRHTPPVATPGGGTETITPDQVVVVEKEAPEEPRVLSPEPPSQAPQPEVPVLEGAAPRAGQAPVVDTLETGEQQPRLPGAGQVREQAVVTPEVADVPFALARDTASAGAVQSTLREAPPEPPRPPEKAALPVATKREPRSVRTPAVTRESVSRSELQELRRIVAEMESIEYKPKTFNEQLHHGGTMEVGAGAAGAPVYWDIVGGNPESGRPTFRYSRGQVLQKVRRFLDDGERSVVSDLAVDVARRRRTGDRTLQPAALPASAGLPQGAIRTESLTSLSDASAAVQREAAEQLEDRGPELVAAYRARFGTVVNADQAKELFPSYASAPERTRHDLALSRPARALARAVFDQVLREPAPEGKTDSVVFLAGGTGSGKSTVLNTTLASVRDQAQLVYDSTLSNPEGAVRDIEAARRAGKAVAIVFVDRDIHEAWQSTLERGRETGRPVTLTTHVRSHLGSRKTFDVLRDRYREAADVELLVIRNTPEGAAPAPVDSWRAASYNEADVRQSLEALTAREIEADALAPEFVAALRGPARAASSEERVGRRDHPGAAPQEAEVLGTRAPGEITPPRKPSPHVKPKQTGGPTGGSSAANIGVFAETAPSQAKIPPPPAGGLFPPATQPTGRPPTAQPIEFPELVDLARELSDTPSVVKAFRKPGQLGSFREGSIRLAAELFTKGNEIQLAGALAHEIGHLVDWLPHQTLKRGNLLGRLLSLQSFLKHTFTTPAGTLIANKDIKAELTALSDFWRPWNPAQSSKSFIQYRHSSRELYADALSVLLTNPGLLEQKAPIFHRQFFEALDRKPDVERAYFDLQEQLAGTRAELVARRRTGIRRMFEEGDVTALDLERRRLAELKQREQHLWFRLRTQLVDRNYAVIDRVRALERSGVRLKPDEDPRYLLEERNYLGGKVKAFVEQSFVPVFKALTEADVHWRAFGEALFFERIIAGDRSELANPRGLSPTAAGELYEGLKTELGPEKMKVVRHAIADFRAAVKGVADQAHQAGLYTDELYAQMQANPAYVTFQVIEHLEDGVTSRVYKQIGTLKDIANPADATILKTLVTLRAIEHQRTKTTVVDFLQRHFPADIEGATTVWTGKGHRPVEPKREDQRLLTYYEKGRLVGRYVDPYIAGAVDHESVGQTNAVVGILRLLQGGFLKPIFTTYNVGFQAFNFARDFARFWKNVPTMTVTRAMKRYVQAIPVARARAFGLPESPTARQRQGEQDLLEAERAGMLSITFNDLVLGREVEDTQIEDILARSGVGGFQTTPTSSWAWPITHLLARIKAVGDFIETLPKAAGVFEFKGAGRISDIPADRRSFIRRKVGSPDFLAGGTWKPVSNEVFLFSNAITQAVRSDWEVATQPQTRSGFWWKTATANLLPKVFLAAGLAGALGETLRRLLQRTTDYDRTNYIVLPLGEDSKGNTIYFRLPQDDSGRLVGGLAWKAMQAARGDRRVAESLLQIVDYGAGQFPSVSPVIQTADILAQLAGGQNPRDRFRGQNLFTEDEWKARDFRTVKKFLGWEFQQLGGGIVWKFYPGEERPRERSTGQIILDLPVISNVIGRFIRITNYGEVEQLRGAGADVQRDEARRRLSEREAVNAAIRTSQAVSADRQADVLRTAARDIARTLYGDDPAEAARRFPELVQLLGRGVLRSQNDPVVDALLAASSNAQKAAILKEAARLGLDRPGVRKSSPFVSPRSGNLSPAAPGVSP